MLGTVEQMFQGGRITSITPMGQLTKVDSQYPKQLQNLAKLPALRQCTQATALKAAKEAEKDQAHLHFQKEIASYKKQQMKTRVEAYKTELELRAEGIKAGVEIGVAAAKHRIGTLQAGHALLEANERVSAWQQVANRSNALLPF